MLSVGMRTRRAREAVAAQLGSLLKRFPNWQYDIAEYRALRAEFYRIIIPAVGKERMVEVVEKLLQVLRRGEAE